MMEPWQDLPLSQKVGQLFILAFPGDDPEKIVPLIQKYQIGGCYISQDNAETFEGARRLSTALQEAARVPLLLGVDQEGAWGVLVPNSVTGPGNLALGVGDDPGRTYRMYGVFAEEMGAVGYQTILGPCADVNLNPNNPIIGTRSFGTDPQAVGHHVEHAVRGIKDHGGIATAKHFPGHGDTQDDTHRDIPVVDKSIEELKENELLPFQAAIDAGVDMIMTSHILFPQLDSCNPATLSKTILTDLLRNQMGFTGLIITDSMNMGAMRKNYSPAEATLKALEAGADLIMLSEEHYEHSEDYLDKQIASIESIIEAVRNNRISLNIIHERLSRIFKFKQERFKNPTAIFSDQGKQEIAESAAFAAIRVLRNRMNLLPLSSDMRMAVVSAAPRKSYNRLINRRGIGPNQKEPAFDSFARELGTYFPNVQIHACEEPPDTSRFDRILLVTEDYPLPGEDFDKIAQHRMVHTMARDVRDKLVVVGLRSSYEFTDFPEIPCYISSESSRTVSARMIALYLARQGRFSI